MRYIGQGAKNEKDFKIAESTMDILDKKAV